MFQQKFDKNNRKKYKVKIICNSMAYAKESNSNDLLNLYYLIF